MSINAIDLAYCAGLFDGEGCVSVSPYTNGEYRRFHCDLFLGMQDLTTIEFFQRTVGVGSINRRRDGLWMWHVPGAKAARVARTLAPHLRTKREAVLLFIEFAATFSARNRKPLPSEIVTTRFDLSRRIRQVMHANAKEAAAFAFNGGTN